MFLIERGLQLLQEFGHAGFMKSERAHLGLSPQVVDHNALMPSGYTVIEEYINQGIDALPQYQ